uniref:3-dehydroquinate synthase n=1 Tax=uncultured Chloroflexota bacterium TaxID=166587 RepID=H5SM23_9CHLR|nr:3-dehydroquinate synthase [uncultured Chloroflexota bacterium]BAL57209.1 3-dehydroquinate synthase [uncultured Chloroflexota bacterium]
MEKPILSVPPTSSAQAIPLYLGDGLLETLLPELLEGEGFSAVFIVTNETLAPLYGNRLAERVKGARLLVVPDGERFKTLETAASLYQQLLEAGADRKSVLVALGGGVIGDLTGFVAATFLRGLPFIQVPTSLLAMVDASLGGKTGVDLPIGKNLVGAFKDPLAIVSDLEVLHTLPQIEFRNGLAEVLKAGLIGDRHLFACLEAGEVEQLKEIVLAAVRVKVDILSRDPLEQGERAFLNLGHTFAHAIEQATRYRVPHGQAVAVGLRAAAWLSERLGFASDGLLARVERALSRLGLRSAVPEAQVEEMLQAMQYDKKRQQRQLRFVLLKSIGQPFITSEAPPEALREVLEVIREHPGR